MREMRCLQVGNPRVWGMAQSDLRGIGCCFTPQMISAGPAQCRGSVEVS